jgi:general L-amino acid transport system substrate-binding protein
MTKRQDHRDTWGFCLLKTKLTLAPICYLALSVAIVICANIMPSIRAALASSPGVLEAVRARNVLNCGVSAGAIGFSVTDKTKGWQGMSVDLCRALAAAVLGDARKVRFVEVTTSRRFTSLHGGEIDVLGRMTAWTLSRDLDPSARFVAPLYHGGYGFLTRKSNGLTSALELTGATVCVLAGSMAEHAAQEFFNRHGMKFAAIAKEIWSDVVKSYSSGQCLVIVADRITLAGLRNTLVEDTAHALLPEVIGSEVFGPVVAAGQQRWQRIVEWLIYGLITAERQAVSSANLDASLRSNSTITRRLLGVEGDYGKRLGLAASWLADAIRQVGNYGEIFERNLGAKSDMQLPRGRNALPRNGGLLFTPAFR